MLVPVERSGCDKRECLAVLWCTDTKGKWVAIRLRDISHHGGQCVREFGKNFVVFDTSIVGALPVENVCIQLRNHRPEKAVEDFHFYRHLGLHYTGNSEPLYLEGQEKEASKNRSNLEHLPLEAQEKGGLKNPGNSKPLPLEARKEVLDGMDVILGISVVYLAFSLLSNMF